MEPVIRGLARRHDVRLSPEMLFSGSFSSVYARGGIGLSQADAFLQAAVELDPERALRRSQALDGLSESDRTALVKFGLRLVLQRVTTTTEPPAVVRDAAESIGSWLSVHRRWLSASPMEPGETIDRISRAARILSVDGPVRYDRILDATGLSVADGVLTAPVLDDARGWVVIAATLQGHFGYARALLDRFDLGSRFADDRFLLDLLVGQTTPSTRSTRR